MNCVNDHGCRPLHLSEKMFGGFTTGSQQQCLVTAMGFILLLTCFVQVLLLNEAETRAGLFEEAPDVKELYKNFKPQSESELTLFIGDGI